MATRRKEQNKNTFEYALKRLEQIMEHLEQGDVPLDDSLKLYEEGITLSKTCAEKLIQVELKLKRLSKDVEGNFQLLDEG